MRPTRGEKNWDEGPVGDHVRLRVFHPARESTGTIEEDKDQTQPEIPCKKKGGYSNLERPKGRHAIRIRQDRIVIDEIVVDLQEDTRQEREKHCVGVDRILSRLTYRVET